MGKKLEETNNHHQLIINDLKDKFYCFFQQFNQFIEKQFISLKQK